MNRPDWIEASDLGWVPGEFPEVFRYDGILWTKEKEIFENEEFLGCEYWGQKKSRFVTLIVFND